LGQRKIVQSAEQLASVLLIFIALIIKYGTRKKLFCFLSARNTYLKQAKKQAINITNWGIKNIT
jgi:hypothetical protein